MIFTCPNARLFALLCFSVFLLSCGIMPERHYADLSQQDKQKYAGTQYGFHTLSKHFAVDVSRKTNTVSFYHYEVDDNGEQKETLIGTISAYMFDFSDFGSRENAFAISEDGRVLLYFHESAQSHGRLHKADGLYVYQHGRGDQLVHRNVDRYSYGSGDLPRNAITFAVKINAFETQAYVRTTEGEEYPL